MSDVKTKPIIYSAINLIGAVLVYLHLITGGWLSHNFDLSDPNVANLLLAIFEPIAVLAVVAYWIWRTGIFYRVLFISFIVQVVVLASFVAFLLLFFFTWKPKMM